MGTGYDYGYTSGSYNSEFAQLNNMFACIVLVYLLSGVVWAIVCYKVSKARGYSPIAWLFVGFFIGYYGLIILLCLENKIRRTIIKLRRAMGMKCRQTAALRKATRRHQATRTGILKWKWRALIRRSFSFR